MEPMHWILSAAVVGLAVAAFFVLATRFWHRFVMPPLVKFEKGAFLRLVDKHLGSPKAPLMLANAILPITADEGYAAKPPSFGETREQSSSLGNTSLWGAATVDGIDPAIDVWSRWSAVDDHIFKAFEHLSHQQIEGVADMLRVADVKEYAIHSASFASKLLGHVGEWHVQEHLMQAGVPVAMPVNSNEPGLDMWADGHPVNVKTYADAASAASSHFSDHPNIPIVVPYDAKNIPAEALHFDPSAGFDAAGLEGSDHLTIVDNSFSHADMVLQNDHALDVLGHPGPHLHFPWVTMAVSALREAQLLFDDKTDMERAAKNIAVDTAAVGGGVAVGMKVGAIVGSPLGPVGTVVGGIFGGLAGAIGGRKAANAVKRLPLDETKQKYEVALAKYLKKEKEVSKEAGKKWQTSKTDEAKALREFSSALDCQHRERLESVKNRLNNITKLDAVSNQRLLKEASLRIDNAVSKTESRIPMVFSWWAMPWRRLIIWRNTKLVSQHKKESEEWKKSAEELVRGWGTGSGDPVKCFDLVLASPEGEGIAVKYLKKIKLARGSAIMEAAEAHHESLNRVIHLRMKSIQDLKNRWEAIKQEAEAAIAHRIRRLKSARKSYRKELRKAGADL